ncbi:MAG TPA: hypothetical protein EYN66_11505, partial [Myxococcales bacterium]|nr:hypothetical protein [Myxococcales bacterium]
MLAVRILCSSLFIFFCACAANNSSEVPLTSEDAQGSTGADTSIPAAEWCEGSTRSLYDPLDGHFLGAWPDDYYTYQNSSTSTGLQIDLRNENAPWIKTVPGQFGANVPELNDLDGFGTSAGIFFRMNKAMATLPSGYPESVENDALQLWELGQNGAIRVPFQVRTTDDDSTIILWLMRMFKPKIPAPMVSVNAMSSAPMIP